MAIKRTLLWLSFLVPLSVYILTLAPGIFWEDSAAFQAAAFELGIVHNPSFPAYVLLAHLFTWLPFGTTPWLVNLCSAVCAAFAALLIQIIALRILGFNAQSRIQSGHFIALACSLGFAFVYGVWVQAVRAEVYSLNLLLILILVWLILKYHAAELSEARFAALSGITVGVGLANHYLILGAVAMPIIAATFIIHRERLLRWPITLKCGMFALLGLSLYLYLPIRESANPLFNWGDFSSLGAALKSILRIDETLPIQLLSTTAPFVGRMISTLIELWHSVPLMIWVFACVGFFSLMAKEKFLSLVIGLLSCTSVLVTAYAAEFSAYNLDLYGYLMPAYSGLFVAAAMGATAVVSFAVSHIRVDQRVLRATVATAIAMVLVGKAGFLVASNYEDANKSDLYTPDEYAESVLISLPNRALFLAGEDNSYSPLLCKQVVNNLRCDVTVISAGALLRSDYRRKVQSRNGCYWYPSNWNDPSFAVNFEANLAEWISMNSKNYQVAMTLSQWTSSLIPKLQPSGFSYVYSDTGRLSPAAAAQSVLFYRRNETLWKGSPDITTREHFGRLLYNLAVFYSKHRQLALAAKYNRDAASTDPTNVELLLGCLKMAILARQTEDQNRLTEAIEILEPGNQRVEAILKAALAVTEEAEHD